MGVEPAFFLAFGVILAAGIWGSYLYARYTAPYTLAQSDNPTRWKRAIILTFVQAGLIPLIGIFEPFLTLNTTGERALSPGFYAIFWLIALPLMSLYNRWFFERTLQEYKKLDNFIKNHKNPFPVLFNSPWLIWTGIFIAGEQKRFLKEGFDSSTVEVHADQAGQE